MMQLWDADYLYVEGGPLDGRYYLHHLEFYWGSDDSKGSEHTINQERYPMESQWVLYSEKYPSYEEASQHPGGVLKMSQMYSITEDENWSLSPIVEQLPNVRRPERVAVSSSPLEYALLLGVPVDDYYYYNGSFTRPPCSETVIWLVYPNANTITEEQLEAFRNLRSASGSYMANNFRQTQPLNGRKVIRSDKAEPERRRANGRRQATQSGRRARHGISRRRGAARRVHH
ncbi:carbonic anhydrase 2-like [Schistocerca piceifrons]|uniref:carbonic anhydrase 2-like n=1 Tax=Schistocerca piceifrons TaxID=274613 RepID=UPI001F5EF126|nr:carbonic anhydrase 2-like [Schistocerca piceifrons]